MRRVLAVVVVAAAPALAAAQPAYTAKVDIVEKDGAHRAVIASKLTCATPSKCPEWTLDLGRVDSASLVGLADLRGEPRAVKDLPATLPESAQLPAAFVRIADTDGAGTKWERLELVSLEGGRAKLIWRGELAMTATKGNGFLTVGDVALVAAKRAGPLAIELVQKSVPRGPQLKRRFVLKDGGYQRE